MKMKEFGLRGARVRGAPLHLPLITVVDPFQGRIQDFSQEGASNLRVLWSPQRIFGMNPIFQEFFEKTV